MYEILLNFGAKFCTHAQAVISWFPDRKGLVSGLVIAGFGSGALLFAPLMGGLTGHFSRVPDYLGAGLQATAGEMGRLLVDTQEVVFCRHAVFFLLPYCILRYFYFFI